MNYLNSVIVEGTIYSVNENGFVVETTRHMNKGNGKVSTEHTLIDITCNKDVYGKFTNKGRGVRIIGRLVRANGCLCVLAEHIEFKPTTNV